MLLAVAVLILLEPSTPFHLGLFIIYVFPGLLVHEFLQRFELASPAISKHGLGAAARRFGTHAFQPRALGALLFIVLSF